MAYFAIRFIRQVKTPFSLTQISASPKTHFVDPGKDIHIPDPEIPCVIFTDQSRSIWRKYEIRNPSFMAAYPIERIISLIGSRKLSGIGTGNRIPDELL